VQGILSVCIQTYRSRWISA